MSRRSNLLPPYLASNPAWTELVESIDKVFEDEIDLPTQLLAKLRDNWILNETGEQKVGDTLLGESDFFMFDRETLIRQANMIGFLFKETDLLSDIEYQRLVRNLGLYWYNKGTPEFADFLAFCLESTMRVVKLFSKPVPGSYEKYGDMREEGDPAITSLNWQGGEWFETSHVNLIVDPLTMSSNDVPKLVALFNALANYHLVLNEIVFDMTTSIFAPGDTIGRIVKAYLMWDIYATIDMRPGNLLQENGVDRLLTEAGELLTQEN